jgi:hypothetical protein
MSQATLSTNAEATDAEIIATETATPPRKPRTPRKPRGAAATSPDAGQKSVTKIERYTELMPAVPLEPDADLDDDVDDDGEPENFEPEQPLSDVEILLQQISDDGDFTLRVERLTEFEIDGRTDARAATTYCMTIAPPSLDYLERIARRCGGGAYQLTMFRRGRGMMRRWTEHIDRTLTPQAAEPSAPAPVAAAAAPPVAAMQPDTLTGFVTQAKQFAEIAKAFGLSRPQPAPLPENTLPPAPTTPPADPFEQTLSVIEKVTSINERINPVARATEGAGGIMSGIAEVLRALDINKGDLITLGSLIAPSKIQQPAPNTSQPTAAPVATTPSNFQRLPQPLQNLLLIIVQDLTRNAHIDRVCESISGLIRSDANYANVLKPLLAQPPSEIVATLAQLTGAHYITELPHSIGFITAIQEDLQAGDEAAEAENEVEGLDDVEPGKVA